MPRCHKYGWRKQLGDIRDRPYMLKLTDTPLPTACDLRQQCPPVYDQGNLGSCTANAIAGAIEFDQIRQCVPAFTPSRLFIYYNERALEGTVSSDAGAFIRDGIKTVNSVGAPPETDWPYDIKKFTMPPPATAYSDALGDLVLQYEYLDNSDLYQLKGCLASGLPFVFGISIYESFETAVDGVIPLPSQSEQLLGGHAVMAVGYDDNSQRFICRNSWGASWGQAGYFTIPYAYLTNTQLASDFWVIQQIGAKAA